MIYAVIGSSKKMGSKEFRKQLRGSIQCLKRNILKCAKHVEKECCDILPPKEWPKNIPPYTSESLRRIQIKRMILRFPMTNSETKTCRNCGRAYRIIEMELQFYRQMNLPIFRNCPFFR